jgi:hypothetical protein
MDFKQCDKVDIDVYRAISISCPSSPILPNLRDLTWTVDDDEIFQYIRLFLTPGLTHLHLFFDWSTSRVSLLPPLKRLCPSITHLDLGCTADSDGIVDVISNHIFQWEQLEVVEASDLNNQAITRLSTLPRLRKLRCQLHDHWQGTSRNLSFPTLQELSLIAVEAEDCLSFVACLDGAKLSHVSLHLGPEGNYDRHGLLLALQRHVSNSALKEVWLSDDYDDENVIPGDILRPLLAFTNLTHLSFCPGSSFATDNSMINDISKACPRLQYLALGECSGSNGHTRVTLAGLIPLVQRCPNLHHLEIVFDASNPDYRSHQNQSQSVSNDNIKEISVGDSRITEPSAVASFLSNIFPELHAIHLLSSSSFVEGDEFELIERLWGEARELVQRFIKERRRERSLGEVFDSTVLSENTIETSS